MTVAALQLTNRAQQLTIRDLKLKNDSLQLEVNALDANVKYMAPLLDRAVDRIHFYQQGQALLAPTQAELNRSSDEVYELTRRTAAAS
jgi:hypothetical protein